KTGHVHIYIGGQSQEKPLEEVETWPTYYPAGVTGLESGQEMLAH
ncbi:ZinT/AdcA family metal-binding protein, partial [Streptococcus suis]